MFHSTSCPLDGIFPFCPRESGFALGEIYISLACSWEAHVLRTHPAFARLQGAIALHLPSLPAGPLGGPEARPLHLCTCRTFFIARTTPLPRLPLPSPALHRLSPRGLLPVRHLCSLLFCLLGSVHPHVKVFSHLHDRSLLPTTREASRGQGSCVPCGSLCVWHPAQWLAQSWRSQSMC